MHRTETYLNRFGVPHQSHELYLVSIAEAFGAFVLKGCVIPLPISSELLWNVVFGERLKKAAYFEMN